MTLDLLTANLPGAALMSTAVTLDSWPLIAIATVVWIAWGIGYGWIRWGRAQA